MKKLYMVATTFLGCLAFQNVSAQLVINGATLFLESGAVVSVQGNLTSTSDIQGTGKVVMNGTSVQEINMNGNTIPNLEINNSSNVTLGGDTRVSGLLEFTNGRILAGGNDFILASSATFTGAGAGKYVETNGIGEVRKEVAAGGSYVLPIGKSDVYMPMEYALAGNTFGAGAYVAGQVVANPHPNKPIRSEDYLTAFWRPTLNAVTGGTVNVTTSYADANSFNGSEAMLNGLRWDGTNWSLAGNTINTAANSVTYNGIASGNELYAMNKFVYATGKVFLQGAFNTGINKMNDNLRAGTNLIPTTDPYRSAPYSTTFTHNNNAVAEAIDPMVFSNQAIDDNNIVDWVFLELRNTSYGLVQTRSALVQKDGDIVEVDGVNPVYFKNLDAGDYVLTVRHRNHLGIAADAATFAKSLSVATPSEPNSFNFTTATDAQIFGTSNAYNVTNGRNLMWGGNANSNANVRYTGLANDKDAILLNALGNNPTTVLSNVYHPADLNMNRVVRYTALGNDKDFLYINVLASTPTNVRTQAIPN